MIEPFGGAAAGFALQLAANTFRDRRRRRRLETAYRTAAAETIEAGYYMTIMSAPVGLIDREFLQFFYRRMHTVHFPFDSNPSWNSSSLRIAR